MWPSHYHPPFADADAVAFVWSSANDQQGAA